MASYQVFLLGGFQFLHQGMPVKGIDSSRLQSLFALLVLHPQPPLSKQQIAALFWPDTDEQQARANLRGLLFRMQRAWPEFREFVASGGDSLVLRQDRPIWLDVAEFQHALEQGRETPSLVEKERLYEQAAGLYKGALFPACYEDWIAPIRDELHRSVMVALEELVCLHESKGDYPRAIQSAERMCRLDALCEPAYRHLMRLNALVGNRATAMSIYKQCEQTLRRDLGVDPDPTTREIYDQILAAPAAEARREEKQRSLVGRAAEWREIQQVWQGLKTGARILMIKGEAGIGKTELAEQFTRWVRLQGGRAAVTRCYAGEGNIAYAPLANWLREMIGTQSGKNLPALALREAARIVPSVLINHPEIQPPGPLAENWQRQQFYDALAGLILPERGKLLLVIDDIQWCDQETLEWLRFLIRFDPAKPVLLLATCRVEEAFDARPLETMLRHFSSQAILSEIDLSGLDPEAAVVLASQVLERRLDEDTARDLLEQTEGNPLYVVEVARAWQQGTRQLPRKILGVIETRLGLLSAPARDLLAQAAVLEREFTYPVLVAACGLDEKQVVDCLDELLKRRLILERGEQGYDFIHAKVREVTDRMLSSSHRGLLNRRAAEALVRVFGQSESASEQVLDAHSAQIAAHFEAGGSPYQAFLYYARAADYAAKIFAHHQAEMLYQQAIRSALKINWSGALLARLYASRGRMLEHLGQFQGAVEVYTELEKIAEEHEDLKMQGVALERLVSCYVEPSLVHSIEKANPLLEKGLEIARTIHDPELEARLLWCRMLKATHYGDPDEAEEAGETCISLARANGLTDLLANSLHDLSLNYRLTGKSQKAAGYAAEAGRLFKQQGNLNLLADHLNQQAVYHYNQVDFDSAMRVAQEAAALSRKLDNKWNLAYALWIQAILFDALGERETAISLWEQSIEVGQAASFLMSLTTVKLQLGHVLRDIGQINRAVQLHREALETSIHLAPFMLIPVESQLALDYLSTGDLPLARQFLQSALDRRPVGVIGSGFCLPYLSMARVEWAHSTGEWQGVLETIQAAVREAQRHELNYFDFLLRYEQGRVLHGLGRPAEAGRLWRELHTQAETAGARLLMQKTTAALALLAQSEGALGTPNKPKGSLRSQFS